MSEYLRKRAEWEVNDCNNAMRKQELEKLYKSQLESGAKVEELTQGMNATDQKIMEQINADVIEEKRDGDLFLKGFNSANPSNGYNARTIKE